MLKRAIDMPFARILDATKARRLDVLGPTIDVLTPLEGRDDDVCVMRGVIPPGAFVSMHSHDDFEAFLQMSGQAEGLSYTADGFDWLPIRPGEVFFVPCGANHAFRNRFAEPAVTTIVSTVRLGRFFERVGIDTAAAAIAPSPERLQHFLRVADEFGYWNASPEENARVGIVLPSPDGRPSAG